MKLHTSNRPVRALTAAGLCLALLGALVYQTFGPFDWLGAAKVSAVGGYDAVNVLGPNNFMGGGTWEFIFFPTEAILEFAYQSIEAEVIWAVTDGSIYYCDTDSTACDEESDWVSYAMSDSLTSIAIDQDITHVVLYVGTAAATTEILRCNVGLSGCDEESDWTSAFVTDLTGSTDTTDALISAGGFMFAGIHGVAASGPTTIFRCDITTDCDVSGDWTDVTASHGGAIRQFMFDDANGVVYAGYSDSSSSGFISRCDLSTTCDEDNGATWPVVTGGSRFNGMTIDTVNDVIYAGFNASNEGGPTPSLHRCETATDCESGDWVEMTMDDNDITSIIWEPLTGFLFAGSGSDLYRCDTADLCDDFADFELVSDVAGQTRFVFDPVNEALFSGGDSVYRCELSTGCGAANELDNTFGVAHDEAGERFFVSDTLRHRVLVYDFSDGITDGEEPVNVLGQTDFTGIECNQDDVAGPATLCQPYELAYDGSNDRLFVGDFTNNRVMVWDLSGPVTNGMAAAFVLGQPDFTSTDCETDQTSLCETQSGIAFDDGVIERLFVGDLFNRRVMVFDVTAITNGEPAINVIGTPDYTTDPSSCSINQATTCSPFGVTLDGDNQILFVADGNANRVTTFAVDPSILIPDDPGSNGPDAINVLGQDDFFSTGAGTSATELFNPSGLSYDSADSRLFVADTANNRVLQFDTVEIDDGEPAVDVYGQDDLDSAVSDTTQSSLSGPYAAVYMPGDDLIAIADSENDRIVFFAAVANPAGSPTLSHEATDVLGQLHGDDTPTFDYSGADNSPNSRGFNGPGGLALDSINHRMFIVDPGNNRVLVFGLDEDNLLVDRIADSVLGQANFRENGAGTSASQFSTPLYAAYDEDNDLLFVSDYGNNRVLVFDVATIDDGEDAFRVLGQPNFDSSAPDLSATDMETPRGVSYDPTTDRLFSAQQDQERVLVFDLSGGISNGMAASWVIGQEDFDTEGSNNDQDGLGGANNIALDVDGQRLFVDDSPFHRVMVFDVASITDGEDAINVIGQEDFTSTGSDLDQDSLDFTGIYGNGLAYDEGDDLLFVGDGSNRRVMVFDADTAVLVPDDPGSNGPDAINVLGQDDFFSEDDTLHQGSTRAASGLAYDADNGLLYTSSADDAGQPNPDNRVSIFDVSTISDGEDAVDLLGQLDENDLPVYTVRGVNNSPNAQGFLEPADVALDEVGHRLFVVDSQNHRVVVFELNSDNELEDPTADFVLGQPHFKADDSGTTQSTLNYPNSVLYDTANQRLFVSDSENHRVLVFDLSDGIDNGEDAISVLGQEDFTSGAANQGGGPEADTLNRSAGLSYDAAAQLLFVSEFSNNRVTVFDVNTIIDGEDAVRVLGQPGFFTDVPATTQTGMNGPDGAHYDATGLRLFIGDQDNNRVLVFDLSGGITNGMPASNVLGQEDFTSNTAATTQDGLNVPLEPFLNPSTGLLYVADYDNNRVMVFDVGDGITDGEDAVDAYGQPDFTTSDCTLSQTGLCLPWGLFYDTSNDTLYISDSGNNRVMIFDPEPSGGGGGGGSPPTPVGFTPGRIIINEDDSTTDSRNVLVDVYATTTGNFTGTVDVLLSNTTSFETFVPFRYVIPERLPNGNNTRNIWPKTIAWDLCFGITDTTQCRLGIHTVYARFYVNVPAPSPVLVRPTNQ